MPVAGFLLASLVGLSLAMLGGGGAILTVPIFVYVMGFPTKLAVAMSLPVIGVASLVGAIGHVRAGNVDVRRAIPFGVAAMAGAFLGTRVSVFVSGAVQLALLGVLMLAAAVSMLRRPDVTPAAAAPSAGLPALLAVAATVGVLTGLVGIGGGFLIVPALVLLARVPMHRAVGTSLVVIAMNSAAGLAGYAGSVELPWRFLAAFTLVAVGGIVAGTRLVPFVPRLALQRAFAVMLLAVGALLLHQNRGAFRAAPVQATAVAR